MESTISRAWADLPAELEYIESAPQVSGLVLAFYHWTITLELADYPEGGVLVTASIASSSHLRRALYAIGNPGHGGSKVIAREVVGNIDEVRSTLDRLGYAIRRHRSVAPFLAGKWRERGLRVGS
jgi:hypothetical protein